jgi:hypothetical protein
MSFVKAEIIYHKILTWKMQKQQNFVSNRAYTDSIESCINWLHNCTLHKAQSPFSDKTVQKRSLTSRRQATLSGHSSG